MPNSDQHLRAIAAYWDEHIHDLAIATHPVGTPEFFRELEEYRYEKLNYLPSLVNFSKYQDARLLEVGCGVGIDLVRFAAAGAQVTGIDLSQTAIDLAGANFAQHGLKAALHVMNGACMGFPGESFDVVYAHGVLQYTPDTAQVIAEIHRVLKPGGEAIMMVYNRISWLSLMRRVTRVPLEHEDSPFLKQFSIGELKELLRLFNSCRIIPERYPVKTRLHAGWKARLFNTVFVNTFNLLPRALIRPLGWHLMVFATK